MSVAAQRLLDMPGLSRVVAPWRRDPPTGPRPVSTTRVARSVAYAFDLVWDALQAGARAELIVLAEAIVARAVRGEPPVGLFYPTPWLRARLALAGGADFPRLARAIGHGLDLDWDDLAFDSQDELMAVARMALAAQGVRASPRPAKDRVHG